MISLKEENACREASKKRKDRALNPCIEVSNRRKKERKSEGHQKLRCKMC